MGRFNAGWVEAQVGRTTDLWWAAAMGRPGTGSLPSVRRYEEQEQRQREQAYDEALEAVEEDLRRPRKLPAGAIGARDRLVALFERFAAKALDLDGEAVDLLTRDFLPIGIELGRQARRFDPGLKVREIIQAARNAWTACGLQPLLGETVRLTPAIFGYSLMYPYSDNYLDDESVAAQTKWRFSGRFRQRLRGEPTPPENEQERALWRLVAVVESQYPRAHFPDVFECLLAIHQAQEQSIQQLQPTDRGAYGEVLRLSCAKGGTSVLADACLVTGSLCQQESQFAFEWGVLLQLGDDLQDLRDDLQRGSGTIFSLAVTSGRVLDPIALQLLRFSDIVGQRMDALPGGTPKLKELLKMSWRSLILRAIADSHEFFSEGFLVEAERCSPFRFQFLRRRSDRLASQHGIYAAAFDYLIETRTNAEVYPAQSDARVNSSASVAIP